ncbi:MAG: hypothetical protein JXA53_08025 [Bacteroidales bacterium]|nr:hypothetical protein [Bacteroidales bacterium]
MTKAHSFHIPIMGIGFTLDTPIKTAHLGIDSVLSLGDDILIEKIRKVYCNNNKLPYQEITNKTDDFRAKRITSYLNMVNNLVEKKFEELKNATVEKSREFKEYFNLLPDSSTLKQEFNKLSASTLSFTEIVNKIKDKLHIGSIDVNIMTKTDRENYRDGKQLPIEYNNTHAALRGYAQSDLNSSIVLSAGMNPRLFTYMEDFEDFYANIDGFIKKKVILKVSDYRSALIQGLMLAKKGIWVSEYRIESGLNCGGHAFASDGYLMGPILSEFKDKRQELKETLHQTIIKALQDKGRTIPTDILPIKFSAQGGVGTSEEHNFLLDYYDVDSIGWGTPFLLVPEATSIDESTIELLANAKEKDLYLSNISPVGVPFNNVRGNTKDILKEELIKKGKPGAKCTQSFLALYREFDDRGQCTASRAYQKKKIEELDKMNLPANLYKKRYNKIVDKACICVGLGTSALIAHGVVKEEEADGVSVCPGPNMAYFSKKMSLKNMIDHIYGRDNMISRTDRPNIFVKELNIYLDYLKSVFEDTKDEMTKKQQKYLNNFAKNLNDGHKYYKNLFENLKDKFNDKKESILSELETIDKAIQMMFSQIETAKLIE